MGNNSASKLCDAEIIEIKRETQFSKSQILRLHNRFQSLDKNEQGYLTREEFSNVPELAVNPLGDRIIDAFFELGAVKDSQDEHLTFRQFVRILAHFQPVSKVRENVINTRKDKLLFAFKMYDLEKNNYITREEFKVILNSMVGSSVTSDQLEKITDKTLEEADQDRDGKISFDDFCRAMEKTDIEEKMSMRFLN